MIYAEIGEFQLSSSGGLKDIAMTESMKGDKGLVSVRSEGNFSNK